MPVSVVPGIAEREGTVGLPGGHTTHGNFGVNVGAGAGNDVESFFCCHAEKKIYIANSRKIEGAIWGALVVAPEEVEGDGVEAGSLHLLEDVTPLMGRGETPVVDFPRPDIQVMVVNHVGVLVPRDCVVFPIVAGVAVVSGGNPVRGRWLRGGVCGCHCRGWHNGG